MKAGLTADIGRREFLGRAAWAVTAAAMGGAAKAAPAPGVASLVGFAAPKLEKIRVGVIGVGGRGGMDYLMDLRWSHCIRNGLPLDMSVYDFATWSSIFELSERSVRNRSQALDIPDFTRGAWKITPPGGLL